MVILHYNAEGVLKDLTKGNWKEIYDVLYGGFEDLEDDEEEEEEEEVDPKQLTKQGYLKDDFIVDDEEGDEEDEEWGYESELSYEKYFN